MRISDWSSDVLLFRSPKFIMLTLVSASCSTFHHADRQPALRRFLIFVAHVAARLEHRRDHRVEADDMRAVADHRDAARVDRLDRAHRVALDARDLHQPDHRSEEHTSELQSLLRISYAVFCLQKKNQKLYTSTPHTDIKQ